MKKTIFCGLTISVLLYMFFVPSINCLSLTNRKNRKEQFYSYKAAKQGFTINYTHSVNKGRVHDFYYVENNMLVLDRTDFVSYGAGISEVTENEGSIFSDTNESYSLTGLNRRMKSFLMAVGVIAEHSISIGNNELYLKEVFKPQTSLKIEIKKVSFFEYILHKI